MSSTGTAGSDPAAEAAAAGSASGVGDARVRALVIADTDSYVKWGGDLAARMPAAWDVSLVVLGSYVQPSARQLADALPAGAAHPSVLRSRELAARLADDAPDVLVLAVRGHVVPFVAQMVAASDRRPVIVTGMPGIVVPPQDYDIRLRAAAEVLIVHSHRERREHATAADAAGESYALALESLGLPRVERAVPDAGSGSIVFATQALVPSSRADRERILERLADAARAHPSSRVVIKTRSSRGESETHRGAAPSYEELLGALRDRPENLVVESGSMSAHLQSAAALVTVSSTALLEAVASDVPAIAIDDFGVDETMMTSVFEGSGLLGSLDDMVAGRFRMADPSWMADNYFHDAADDDWIAVIEEALARRASDGLPAAPPAPGGGSGLYYRLDALTPWRGTPLEPLERAALAAARALNRRR